ncbi:MAG: hypothetical protein Q8J92_06375 [Parvibaculum sp.]|nr:hypothetical protein [Parvibaculum sp.]
MPVHEIDSFVTDELIALLGRQAELCRIIDTDDPAQMDVAGAKAALTAAEIKLRPCRDIVLQIVDKVTALSVSRKFRAMTGSGRLSYRRRISR